MVYLFEAQKFKLVAEKEVKGAVYSLASLGNKLLCTINSSVRLFVLTVENDLLMECGSHNFITALYVKTKGDLVLVADIMRSMTLFTYKSSENQLVESAKDYNPEWMTACEVVEEETVIGAENAYNLFTCRKDAHADTEDERSKFAHTGYWYLGENVNVFRRGFLLTSNMNPSAAYSNPIVYGTTDGGLGVIVQLQQAQYE